MLACLYRLFGLLTLLVSAAPIYAQVPQPASPILPQGHSHNDYAHAQPLWEALAAGMGSLEADLYLRRGRLMVAHHPWEIRRERSLEALYLRPLDSLVRLQGSVYPGGQRLMLWLDCKERAARLYPPLQALLARYASLFTRYSPSEIQPGPIQVILTGRRPDQARLERDSIAYCLADTQLQRIHRIDDRAAAKPIVTVDFRKVFGRVHPLWGLSPVQQFRLGHLLARLEADGSCLRFYRLPEQPALWQLLSQAGVCLLSTDAPTRFRAYMLPSRGI